jgi:hypothetical protein
MSHLLGKKVWQIQDQKDKSKKKSSCRRKIRTAYKNQHPLQVRLKEKNEMVSGKCVHCPGTKNQMKLSPRRSLYHKKQPLCDLSDEISSIQQFKIIAD